MQADGRASAIVNMRRVLTILLLVFTGCVPALAPDAANPAQKRFVENRKLDLPLKMVWITPLVKYGDNVPFRPLEFSSPVVFKDKIYVGVSTGGFFALNKSSGDVLWQFVAYGPVECAAAVDENVIAFGDSDGMFYALDTKTGMAKWTYKASGEVLGHPALKNGKIYFATSHNRIYCLDAENGQWMWMHQRDVPGTFTVKGVSGIVIQDDLLFAGFSDGYIVAMNPDDGREVWKNLLNIGEQLTDVDSTPVLDGDFLYVAAYDGNLYGLGRRDGEIRWKYEGGESVSKPVVKGDALFVSTSMGPIVAVDKFSGEVIWKTDIRREDKSRSLAQGPVRRRKNANSPVIFKDVVFSASNYGFLYALDHETGSVRWRWNPGVGISGDFAVESDRIFFLGNMGQLFSMIVESPVVR